jgi:hypothetical protein
MATAFERRVSALEKSHNTRFHGCAVLVVFSNDGNEAVVSAGNLCYRRTRDADETQDDFEHRVAVEAGKLGHEIVAMTRERFDELARRGYCHIRQV